MSIIIDQSIVATENVSILSELLIYDAAAILLTTSISNANLSTDNTSSLSATAINYLSATAEIDPTKLKIIDSSPLTNLQFFYTTSKISTTEFRHQNYLSLLVTLKNAQSNNLETNQYPTLTNNIPSATITKNELLDAIFLFELEELSTTLLFSGAALEEKPITVMYTNAKVDGHSIKLILDSGSTGSIITKQLIDQLGCRVDYTASTRIIITNGATKTLIGEIDDFSFEVNSIIIPTKVLMIEAT
ncbi:hypothetical protein G9A89_013729 [Geosiphon pyriformis]|nr:hypothetical protein G9A89_013729 [Geosiphon pyriformis]